ncbi:hypothetical protein [Paenibacillus polymyxa]|uniref:hypothetical protein n=1 Tax=Paenibacillus polymyxa TaxID=1406 RepID=UPI0006C5CB3C|nr:hypothetical protein [Paenibacillus polymyxa]KOS03837.1 hypothetical protein AM598_04405 [Paenibacillus polymyxa]
MKKFSALQKQKTGSKVYGDTNYVDNVLRYYDGDTSSVSSGKTKNKYTLPSVSDMAKAKEDAQKTYSELDEKQYQNRVNWINDYITESQNKLDNIDSLIAISQSKQSAYSETSSKLLTVLLLFLSPNSLRIQKRLANGEKKKCLKSAT